MASAQRLTVHSPRGVQSLLVETRTIAADLAEILRRAGLPLNTRCGRRGLCNGCLVEVLRGGVRGAEGQPLEPGQQQDTALVRACQLQLLPGQDVEIRIPARSLLAHEPQIVASFRCNVSHASEPLWQHVPAGFGRIEGASSADWGERLRTLGERYSKALPVRLGPRWEAAEPRRAGVPLALEYAGEHWMLQASGLDDGRPAYGLAIDVGTTTVAALLVELETARVAATASNLNAQIALGDNVLTRINLCMQDKNNIRPLQEAVTAQTFAPLVAQLCSEAGIDAAQIVTLCVAGNTTMLHLLCGVDPSSLGVSPFTPQFLDYRRLPLEALPGLVAQDNPAPVLHGTPAASGLRAPASVHLLPSAAAYVGADITAGVFSSGMAYRREPCLLVDIGTNGEIVLSHDGQLIGCATAAGPAFEGAGMTCGVRAGQGAVSHVRLDGGPPQPRVEVIGDVAPIGICGTGYVDFVAQARARRLIGSTGRMSEEGRNCAFAATLPRGRGFRIAAARGGEPLVVSEADVACLLQAKAAIAAGIVCLLNRFGLTSRDIHTVYLAGGFGFHMDLDNLIGCGILPGFQTTQIEVVGNTSLAGAFLALVDAGSIEEMKRIASALQIVELNLEPNFASCYIDQLFLP